MAYSNYQAGFQGTAIRSQPPGEAITPKVTRVPWDIAKCQGRHFSKLKIIIELTLLAPEAKVTRVPWDIARCQGHHFPKVTRVPWEGEGFLVPVGQLHAKNVPIRV